MAKAEKKKPAERKKRGQYDEKIAVKGTLMDIVKAAVKHREENLPSPKKS